MIRYLVLLSVLCVARATAADSAYRLNTPIIPESYDISITPFFNTQDVDAFTFNGEVTIKFHISSNVNQIKLHSEDLNYTATDITLNAGNQNVGLHAASPLEFVKNYTFAYINLSADLQVGITYTLKITYRGPIRADLTGFYRNYYYENGVKKWLGATQMEPTHARKVFPCFDEPSLKAIFTLTIDRPQNFQPSRANTKMQASVPLNNGYVREIFHPTPKMSTYLIAFVVSEFETARSSTNGTKEFGIITRPQATNQSEYAFEIGNKAQKALGDYFGISYYSMDTNLKLDHVALPDFKAGAMENWGLVAYKEGLLLYVPEESTPYYKYRVASIIAHETTHMWFGDLITCHWWSDTWLNEGFANYFQDFILTSIEPDVGAGDALVIGSVYAAYDADSSPDSVPISNENVNSPSEIRAHFGTITYQKAGSVIRMMHHLIGDEAFILGLNFYLKTNEFQPGYPQSLYSALNEGVTSTRALDGYSDANIGDIMGSWISQAGYPLLNVNINYETGVVNLSQKRFYINSSHESDEVYKIPITYTTSSSFNFNTTKPAFIMNNKTYSFQIANLTENWVLFNLQETGLYRVNYDDHSWHLIIEALKSNQWENIHRLNRAKIINDLSALWFSDYTNFGKLKDVFELLKDETDYSILNVAIKNLNKLRNLFLGTEVVDEIENFAIELLNSVITNLGYDVNSSEGTVSLRNRMQVLEFACKLGHTGCNENAIRLFKSFKENGTYITPSLRPVAYCYGLRNGDESDYDFLWNRMMTTNIANERAVIMDALGCTSSETKLKEYLYSMQKEDTIRVHDLNVPLASVLSNYKNVQLVFKELKENYDNWTAIYPSMDGVLTSVVSLLYTQDELNEFETWLSSCSHCTKEAIKAASTALNTRKAYANWAQAHKDEVARVLKNFAPKTSTSLTFIMFVTSVVFCLKL